MPLLVAVERSTGCCWLLRVRAHVSELAAELGRLLSLPLLLRRVLGHAHRSLSLPRACRVVVRRDGLPCAGSPHPRRKAPQTPCLGRPRQRGRPAPRRPLRRRTAVMPCQRAGEADDLREEARPSTTYARRNSPGRPADDPRGGPGGRRAPGPSEARSRRRSRRTFRGSGMAAGVRHRALRPRTATRTAYRQQRRLPGHARRENRGPENERMPGGKTKR